MPAGIEKDPQGVPQADGACPHRGQAPYEGQQGPQKVGTHRNPVVLLYDLPSPAAELPY
jgi:hypothetical protein